MLVLEFLRHLKIFQYDYLISIFILFYPELIGDLVRDEKRAKFSPNFDTIQVNSKTAR